MKFDQISLATLDGFLWISASDISRPQLQETLTCFFFLLGRFHEESPKLAKGHKYRHAKNPKMFTKHD